MASYDLSRRDHDSTDHKFQFSVDETVQYDHSCVSDLASSESDWLASVT